MKTPVWFTRDLTESDVHLIHKLGFKPIVHPLIDIRTYTANQIFKQAKHVEQPDALLFTSQNAVKAFILCRKSEPEWLINIPVFSVGKKTQQYLSEYRISSHVADEQTGTGIAKKLISTSNKGAHIWHFCGNKKRSETGNHIREAELNYIPIECYETIELLNTGIPQEPFKAVVFYSPSAVRVFAGTDGYQNLRARIIAIGETTANELSSFGLNDSIIPEEPSTEHILHLLTDLYNGE